MSNSYINIRFGCYHLQLNHSPLQLRWSKNDYWVENKPSKWLEVYEFFWYKGF